MIPSAEAIGKAIGNIQTIGGAQVVTCAAFTPGDDT